MIEGSCHCGAVRLTLPEAPAELGSCNCSMCRRIGGLWGYYALLRSSWRMRTVGSPATCRATRP